jgi:hypothetical protein
MNTLETIGSMQMLALEGQRQVADALARMLMSFLRRFAR